MPDSAEPLQRSKREAATESAVGEAGERAKEQRRSIPGNFSYTTAPGVLTKILQRLIKSERPPQFTYDFVSTVLQSTGGSARTAMPILKRMGLVSPDGVPTELYSQFQSDIKRPQAALQALKNGWPELFRKNRYVHKADRSETEELFREITGLPKSDKVFKAIAQTYFAVHEFAAGASEASTHSDESEIASRDGVHVREERVDVPARDPQAIRLGLSNQINIILPATTEISVYNAIFRSLKETLLS